MQGRAAAGVIGPQLVVRGRLAGRGDLRVEGVVEGEVAIDGTLSIGPDGAVVGPVEVRVLEVAGELYGNVEAAESVAIRAGGRVQGDVRAARVAIDDGASLHGGIEMEFELAEEEPR